jgi:hypothetical protein
LVGRPTGPDLLKFTKKRPCAQSGFAKKKKSQTKILLKKGTNIQKIEIWQAPNA